MARPSNFEKSDDQPQKRVRASEHALKTAIKAMKDCGLSVGKVCINGGRIEIHTAGDDGVEAEEDNGGLEKW
jgi:hypothetical protein